jgi:hypothetical protein
MTINKPQVEETLTTILYIYITKCLLKKAGELLAMILPVSVTTESPSHHKIIFYFKQFNFNLWFVYSHVNLNQAT